MEEEEEARKAAYLKLPEPAARMPRIAPMMEAAEIKPPVSGADDKRRTRALRGHLSRPPLGARGARVREYTP